MEGPEEGRERADAGQPQRIEGDKAREPGSTGQSREPVPAAEPREAIPLGQRLFDNWRLLLLAGLAVMLITYTTWGLVEILTLPQAPLP